MRRKILVLGGTRFFGIQLVQKLIENDDDITVASRSISNVSFPSEVKTIRIEERDQEKSLEACQINGPYDIIYDQICFSPNEASLLLKCLSQSTKKLIHTSTLSVYPCNGEQYESNFDPFTYPLSSGSRNQFTYSEGKRLAEAVYFQTARIPVTSVRLPVVLGPDDYTGRLDFHIKRIAAGQTIAAINPKAQASLIQSHEAADFLFWIGLQDFNGPINACSDGEISLYKIIELIEKTLNKKAILTSEGNPTETSPYSQSESWYLNNSKAKSLGYQFTNIQAWLPLLIKAQALKFGL